MLIGFVFRESQKAEVWKRPLEIILLALRSKQSTVQRKH